jgi:hypothetical protein
MKRYVFIFAVVALLVAGAASAQNPTGLLTGNVTDGQAPLPGVTVTVTSPNQQGERTGVTNENGDYILRLLPPGEYKVVFALEGFQTIETAIKISAAQTSTVNAEMPVATIAEEITVTGTLETVSATSVVAATATKQLVDDLPMGRTLTAAVFAAPGTSTINSIGVNAVTISGGQTYENLWLVNGVVINENVRQQALNLYIEDSIQETTTQTAGVSAEYGRFAGGVITSITKSGGNQFTGSLRFNFDNPSWNDVAPFGTEGADKTNTTIEATLGGFVMKDKLWFFAAGRDIGDRVTSFETSITRIPYDQTQTEERFEGKLTWSITPEHRLIGSYFDMSTDTENSRFTSAIYDLASLTPSGQPQTLYSLNYNGVLSDNFFVEGQYSKRDLIVGKNSGGNDPSEIGGTLLLDLNSSSRRYWSPTFCGAGPPSCPDKERNNENYLAKASWFLSSPKLGSHDLTFGYDHFEEFNLEENHQSASDYRIYTSRANLFDTDGDGITETVGFPSILPSGNRRAYFYYQPQLTPSIGSKMNTDSFYVNDRWRLNNNWSFNVGVRYDANDGTDSSGEPVADDSRFSPRLGVSWDPKGDGEWLLSATASRYVMSIIGTGNVGDATSAAGLTSVYLWYGGPAINPDTANPNYPTTELALQAFFDWLRSVGGAFEWANDSTHWRFNPSYPGLTPVLLETLDSPYVDEYTIGAAKRFGGKGLLRFDYVHREFGSFYTELVDLDTGTWTNPAGLSGDRAVRSNDKGDLERTYDGIYLTGSYRIGDNITLGGNYTWSEAKGNVLGETDVNGPISVGVQYPEAWEASWNRPVGYLPVDQTHRARLWGSWDIFRASWHRLNLGIVDSFVSGTPYSATQEVDVAGYVTNPGYVAFDTTHTYYFSERGAYRWEDTNSFDVALTYAFTPKLWGRSIEIYIKPEVRNAFNEQAQINGDTTTEDAFTHPTKYSKFDPFTETPVEGVHWGKGPNFGKGLQSTHYQTPRTYLLAVGIRL